MNFKKQYIFCGGGSGGHVLPALSIIKEIQKRSPRSEIFCVGSKKGIESRLLSSYSYKAISTGKLRRYFSIENAVDLFRVGLGVIQAFLYLLKFRNKDSVVVATGGFVIVPVVLAAWLQRKSVILHEQTTRAGLANRIASFFSKKCLLTFEESKAFFPPHKSTVVGYPFRSSVFSPDKVENFSALNFLESNKKTLFLTGGGNGSKLLNEALGNLLPKLNGFQIVHQCGSAFIDDYSHLDSDSYKAFDFLSDEMIPLMNEADVVISRSGAGTVCELMALGKPSILIPLKIAQKNEQFHNAMAAHKELGSIVIEEDELNEESLLKAIHQIQEKKGSSPKSSNPMEKILEEIGEV